jgi:uncharacterized protein (DUF433 family)
MSTATGYKHIQLKEDATAMIEGTTMKVRELVMSHLTYGWSAEELHFQFPHITLSKIYSALAYYWDHKESIDGEIEHELEIVKEIQKGTPVSRMEERLREKSMI